MAELDSSSLPPDFSPQTRGLESFSDLASLPPAEIVDLLHGSPARCTDLLAHSYDKRYTPSTFMEEIPGGYRVGWFDRDRRFVQSFSRIAEAGADYLLFSFGKGRLAPDG